MGNKENREKSLNETSSKKNSQIKIHTKIS